MEFEKHEKRSLLNENLEKTLTVSSGDSEAKPPLFTFVPTVRRLPTHSELADKSKFLVKIPEELSDKNPETVNRSNFGEYLTSNPGSQQERDQGTLTYPSEVCRKTSQGREFKANKPQGMQQSDLFKAEYVFTVDSEGEEEATSRKGDQSSPGRMGTTVTRPKSLAISSSLVSDVVRPKTRATQLQAPSYLEMPHGVASQQKHGQLTSSTTSEQLACKPPAFSFASPTNQKPPPDPVNLDGASVLEEFHTRRLDVSGALVEETATYFQTSAHSAPFLASKGTSSTLRFPHSTQLSAPSPPISLTRTKELTSPCALSMSTDPENKKPKQYKTKSSYKAFAAIPTNTLLLEQKALDEPAKTESVSKDSPLDLPLEFCSPAQLRQQTEELCATIDKVLQDSLSMHSSDSPSSSLKRLLGPDTTKASTSLPRAAGRETKYANLSLPSSTVSESQLTKPGVIRPVLVKSKILLKKEEEVYEPNPFSKYLEDNTDLFSDQDVTIPHKPVSLHPLYKTRLSPPAKSLLHPQALSHADCLSPGPFSHLSSFSLTDEREHSHTLFSHNAYNKLSHPMVAIPEHETLDSKEMRKLRLMDIS
ncbi:muscular LMNA-interacting protein isoform X11 [Saccopteryx leptura]|uniref:muscular LMNA-interacting protein isoform X11 n=1 Tax=Saccopteryx leptura TaxID=249018 RepID=UPI00339C1CEE